MSFDIGGWWAGPEVGEMGRMGGRQLTVRRGAYECFDRGFEGGLRPSLCLRGGVGMVVTEEEARLIREDSGWFCMLL